MIKLVFSRRVPDPEVRIVPGQIWRQLNIPRFVLIMNCDNALVYIQECREDGMIQGNDGHVLRKRFNGGYVLVQDVKK